MSTELASTGIESAHLDLLLSQYLQSHRVELHRTPSTPWHHHGQEPGGHNGAAICTMDHAIPASLESSPPSDGIGNCD